MKEKLKNRSLIASYYLFKIEDLFIKWDIVRFSHRDKWQRAYRNFIHIWMKLFCTFYNKRWS